MKLASIINLWDGEELLVGSMRSVASRVDLFIIVYQTVSNFGEHYDPLPALNGCELPYILIKFDPDLKAGAGMNERDKRNLGLQVARDNRCTHFLNMDCDEYYEDFSGAVDEYIDTKLDGLACKMFTYFKLPTLRLENLDDYYVPFIHELKADTVIGGRGYPFYCDPTRAVNTKRVLVSTHRMHHFSWVRSNIQRKADNSTAKANIAKSDLLKDYYADDTVAGKYLKDYKQKLIDVPDQFNIGAMLQPKKESHRQ